MAKAVVDDAVENGMVIDPAKISMAEAFAVPAAEVENSPKEDAEASPRCQLREGWGR